MAKLNVEGLAERVNLKGQNVLMRVDLNVPLAKVGAISYLFKWNFVPNKGTFFKRFVCSHSKISFAFVFPA